MVLLTLLDYIDLIGNNRTQIMRKATKKAQCEICQAILAM